MSKLRDLDGLFEDHVASSFEKQEHLAQVIGEHAWEVEMSTGTLTFKQRTGMLETGIQLLGTQSFLDNTWLWAWGNEESEIPEDLLGAADHLREVGERDGIASFSNPELAIDENDGHRLAMIACGMLQMPGYYRGPYGDGAAFFLIHEAEWAFEQVARPALRVATLFPQVLTTFEIANHARALRGHLRYHGAEITEDRRDRATARFPHGDTLRALFDEHGRLKELSVEQSS